MTGKDYLVVFTGVRLGIDTLLSSLSLIKDGSVDDLVVKTIDLQCEIGEVLGKLLLMDMKAGDFKEVTDEVQL